MRKFAATLVFVLGLGASAGAADLPAAAPIVKAFPAPVFTWTGFYIGANAGFGWATGDLTVNGVSGSGNMNGAIAGGQLGYNWQTGNIVWGVEADGQWSGQKATSSEVGLTETDKVQWFSTVRGRVGYAADRWLFYVTGGGAFVDFKSDVTITNFGTATWKESRFGWTVGGGIENAIDNHWSWKIEYLFIDTGSFSTNVFGVVPATASLRDNIVRGGINYRF